MPTGYTADVANGKVADFATFALRCARAFGATIMQRDDPMDEPPKHREPSDFYAKSLAGAEARLVELAAMTLGDAEAAAKEAYDKAVAQCAEWNANIDAENARYDAMREQVRAWEPPTAEHEGLKSFMLEQLATSRTDYRHEVTTPKQDGRSWLDAEITTTRERIGRYAKEVAEERARCALANSWIDALYESVKGEAVPA